MAYIRKTEDEFTLQGFYFGTWEDLTCETTRKEIRDRKKEYQENEPGVPYRIRKKRVPIAEVAVSV